MTVLPPVDLSIPDEFDMLLEAPYEYISEALLNRDFPTVADNSNHHKESRHSSVLNTNTEIDHTVPIGKNYTISHSDEDKKAYKEGLHEKLHNNTGIKNVTLEVMPISVSYHENGNLITKKLSTKKEQYDFYYEVFSKLNESALGGYIKSMEYDKLDNILDSNNKPLFDFKFSDIAANKEKIIRAFWYTTLPIAKHNDKLILYKHYTSEEYPKYDNYDAINVDKTCDIPADYDGVMGVPISFLD